MMKLLKKLIIIVKITIVVKKQVAVEQPKNLVTYAYQSLGECQARLAYLHFVSSGDVGLGNGSLRNFGRNGNGWSHSAVAYGVGTWAANAYRLAFDPSTVYPSYGPDARWYGIPVRCLVYQ